MNKKEQIANDSHEIDIALTHHQAGRLSQAEAMYRRVLKVSPENPDALHLLGMIAHQTGNNVAAINLIGKAIEVNPSSPAFYSNLGNVYLSLKRYAEAVACYEKALVLDPKLAEASNNMGMAYREQGIDDKALECYAKAIALRPNYAEARWAVTMAQLPAIYTREGEPERCRHRFEAELQMLELWISENTVTRPERLVGSHQPFYLAYQHENNRDLLSRYGKLCVRLMRDWAALRKLQDPVHQTGDITRIGVVSAHIQDHSVWNAIIKGWVQHLDRKRFAVQVFHVGNVLDEESRWAQSHASVSFHGNKELAEWVDIIRNQQPHVLIYPEIGMDPVTSRLASLRLAPVQAASWGHPETTGLPTMDYFLSAETLEPPGAEMNYTERLVALPGLGCCYHPPEIKPRNVDIAGYGIENGVPMLFCPGTPFKYLPEYDRVLVDMAARLGRCRFLFFEHQVKQFSRILRQRLGNVFSRNKLDPEDYISFIPWQEKAEFYGLMRQATVFLDTIGFSGFNTAIQAMECGLPVVTMDGEYMRGRLASGILRKMGMQELVAADRDEYIEMAVRIVQDENYRVAIKDKISKNRNILFNDETSVRALEKFLCSVLGKQ